MSSVIEERLKTSSIYAVAKIGQSQSKFRRILWFLVLLIGVVGCSFQLYRFLTLYFEYPIIVDLETERKMALDFPAVTVCSLNDVLEDCDVSNWYCKEMTVTSKPFKILNGNVKYENYVSDKHINNSIIILADAGENTNMSGSTLDNPDKDAFISIFNETNRQGKQRPNSKYMMKFGKSRNEKHPKILNTRSFIQNCFFNSESCSAKYFNRFKSLKYGDCYTFKSVDKRGDSLRISKTGINTGLELDLDMEYGAEVTKSVGARIAIHDRSELPDIEAGGLSITPGFETSVALRETLIHRLPPPYKDECVHYKTGNRKNQTDQTDCVYSCIQEWNGRMCGCADPSLPLKEDLTYCDSSNVSLSSCLKFIFESATVRETCDCPLPCISKAYNEVVSQAVWPAENLFRGKYFQGREQFRKRHARVKVYFSSFETDVFQQRPMFQESELFSHLGGELGLWLGLSLIALFEVMETLMCFLKYFICCCCKPRKELFY